MGQRPPREFVPTSSWPETLAQACDGAIGTLARSRHQPPVLGRPLGGPFARPVTLCERARGGILSRPAPAGTLVSYRECLSDPKYQSLCSGRRGAEASEVPGDGRPGIQACNAGPAA